MKSYELFDENTQAIIYGMRAKPIQRMLDFDYICNRKKPSIAAIIDPSRETIHKTFYGSDEILIPVYRTIKDATKNHKNADVMINFASFRSAYKTTMEALKEKTIRTVVVIAEGIPERHSRVMAVEAKKRKKWVIGPATVGGMRAGAFRIGNTAGTIENIIISKLYRPGCVGFVSKSGGLSNEMYNIISRNTNGLYEGIAIGGDKFPGSSLINHILRFEKNPKIKMIVVLGEVGGISEYKIVEALKEGKIKKPLVIWVTGTCAKVFPSEVQFGHAGAKARSELETADVKNKTLRDAGAVVPKSFDDFDEHIKKVYESLRSKGVVKDIEVPTPTPPPLDYSKAIKQKLVRKPTGIVCSISNDKGDEHSYLGVPISEIIGKGYSLGDVIGMLWFKKKFPKYGSEFIELVLKIVADHGAAVAGAHNAIVASRAGKDLMSSLASGLLTIGPRFGGAIDGAAKYFRNAKDTGMKPQEFVADMKSKGILIPGIGHRIKSINNPDKRVEILKKFAKKNFPKTEYLDYALDVEKITTMKRSNLILNVDGCVGILTLDLLNCIGFKKKEIDEILEIGGLNTFFVLGRSIGIIGHILDQKRLKQRLYRHPLDDILYLN